MRDDARAVLVTVMRELGAGYMPYVCRVLRAALPDKGFTAHVLGYTLHAVLEAVVKDCEPGALDEAAEDVLPVVEAELFGEVAAAKDASIFAARYKEAKRCRANETYQLLATGVTFSSHMTQLLLLIKCAACLPAARAARCRRRPLPALPATRSAAAAVALRILTRCIRRACARTHQTHPTRHARTMLPSAASPAVRNKLTQLLQYAARGVARNPSAGPLEVLTFAHNTLTGCLEREEAARERSKAAAVAATSVQTGARLLRACSPPCVTAEARPSLRSQSCQPPDQSLRRL